MYITSNLHPMYYNSNHFFIPPTYIAPSKPPNYASYNLPKTTQQVSYLTNKKKHILYLQTTHNVSYLKMHTIYDSF